MEEYKYLSTNMLSLYDDLIKEFINGQFFIGTYEEYEIAYANNKIPINALVIITDEKIDIEDKPDIPSTTAVLGYAILGQMVLG